MKEADGGQRTANEEQVMEERVMEERVTDDRAMGLGWQLTQSSCSDYSRDRTS
jgi:hypothetical protein